MPAKTKKTKSTPIAVSDDVDLPDEQEDGDLTAKPAKKEKPAKEKPAKEKPAKKERAPRASAADFDARRLRLDKDAVAGADNTPADVAKFFKAGKTGSMTGEAIADMEENLVVKRGAVKRRVFYTHYIKLAIEKGYLVEV